MSYDINLLDPITKKVIEINDAHFMRGGTYQMGGSTELSLNITYNYSEFLHRVLQPKITPSECETGIRSLYGMTALEAIIHSELMMTLISQEKLSLKFHKRYLMVKNHLIQTLP